MVEATDDDNLPCGVSVNHTYVNPTKAKQVSVILLNTNSYNVWIRQPLYAAAIWDVELKDWDYEPIITKSDEANMFEVKLQPVPPEDLREEILSNATEINQETNDTSGRSASKEKDEKPSFGARPNTKDPHFDFKKKLERLPFELNIGDAPLTRNQQARLIDVIYSHTEVFHYLTETWGSATSSSTVSQQLLTNQSICPIGKFLYNCNPRSENVSITG